MYEITTMGALGVPEPDSYAGKAAYSALQETIRSGQLSVNDEAAIYLLGASTRGGIWSSGMISPGS